MKKINVGLIGYGYIGKIHNIAYKVIPIIFPQYGNVYRLSAMVSSKTQNLEGTGFDNLVSSIYDLKEENLDMIDICTPNFLHFEQSSFFIKKGSNIYCEKPMTVNSKEGLQILDLIEERKTITQVALIYRFMPAISKARAIIKNNCIGEVINFRGQFFHSSYLNPKRAITWRLKKSMSGGGAIADLGIHLLDALVFLLGYENVDKISAKANTVIKERPSENGEKMEKVDVDDWGLMTLELKNGAVGTTEVSKVSYNPYDVFEIEIYGTNGYVKISDKNPYEPVYSIYNSRNSRDISEIINSDNYINYLNSIYPNPRMSMGFMVDMHTASLLNMIINVINNKIVNEATPTFEESMKSHKLLEEAYLSIQ